MANKSGAYVANVQNNATGNNIAQGSAHQYNANAIYFGQEKPPIGLAVAEDAPFNSLKNQYEPLCLFETRVEIRQNIESWADRQDETYIFWLNGMAGTGKSTVARTIARKYYNQKRLGASFFFTRGGGDVAHAGKFVTSIASQLAEQSDVLKSNISEAVLRRPNIGSKSLQDQWSHLILEPLSKRKPKTARAPSRLRPQWSQVLLSPLSKLKIRSAQSPLLIVIDALDECDDDRDIRAILLSLGELNCQHTSPIRVFLTSRPETPVRLGFHAMPGAVYHRLDLHNVPRSVVDKDISIFFRTNFKMMRDARGRPSEWPDETSLMLLVQKSEGLFIYAATICRFVKGDEESMTPQNLLQIFLLGDNPASHHKSLVAPTFQLDEMYTKVLKHSFKSVKVDSDRVAGLFRRIIGSIAVLWDPLSEVALSELISTDLQEVNLRLRCLHSVLNIPRTIEAPIRIGHTSFRDFLLDKNRCLDQRFWIDERQRHRELFKCCLQLLSSKLRKDILGLQAPGSLVEGVDRSHMEQHIPPEVKYACLYWIKHLQKSDAQISDNDDVHQFLLGHLLHWLEALSWIGRLTEGLSDMILLENEIPAANRSNLHAFVRDVNRFALYNRTAIERAPLQLYVSALVFTPENSLVRRQFKDEVPAWIHMKSKIQADWDAARQSLEGHSDVVTSVAFSPDGKVLASASRDCTVRLWDAATGAARQTLEGHFHYVTSVAFSPDGKVLASASWDHTVRLWDAATGAALKRLVGRPKGVTSVAFSPDGSVIASASRDDTVMLWDAATGAAHQRLEGDSYHGSSIAFSPDGSVIASASWLGKVRLWDAATGAARQTLEGHSFGNVISIAFSPDGSMLASASRDGTIRLWDAATGAARGTFDSHSDGVTSRAVTSVAFSLDGKVLASASYDRTVRLWDAATGAALQTLQGHVHYVTSVAFSPDSSLLASASWDHTVRLWDAATGAAHKRLEGRSKGVTSVAFSPDGSVIASASWDGTVMLWDAATGAAHKRLEGHLRGVTSVAFSPDGKVLASASRDGTVRLWDAATGAARQTLDGRSGAVTSVAFSPCGSVLASASRDGTVMLWDAATGATRQALEGHFHYVTSIAFSPDGSVLVSASYDGTVRLWDVAMGVARHTLEGRSDGVTSVAFSPDGSVLASGSRGGTVRLWDAATGAARRTLESPSGGVTSVAFSPDGNVLASASRDGTVRLWDAATGAARRKLELGVPIASMSFSSSGQYLNTNRGSFRLSLPDTSSPNYTDTSDVCLNPPHTSSSNSTGTSDGFSVVGEWINKDGNEALWLPPDYRADCVTVFKGVVVLGHTSGRVSIFQFARGSILVL